MNFRLISSIALLLFPLSCVNVQSKFDKKTRSIKESETLDSDANIDNMGPKDIKSGVCADDFKSSFDKGICLTGEDLKNEKDIGKRRLKPYQVFKTEFEAKLGVQIGDLETSQNVFTKSTDTREYLPLTGGQSMITLLDSFQVGALAYAKKRNLTNKTMTKANSEEECGELMSALWQRDIKANEIASCAEGVVTENFKSTSDRWVFGIILPVMLSAESLSI